MQKLLEVSASSADFKPFLTSDRASGLSKVSIICLLIILFVFPLFFGGTYPDVYYPSATALIAISALILVFSPNVHVLFGPYSFRILSSFAAILLFLLAQYLLLSNTEMTHPILGTVGQLHSVEDFSDAVFRLIFFIAIFIIVRSLPPDGLRRRNFFTLLVMAGVLLASIGIVHWFYDDGLLFWNFAPEYVASSERARWPFVNSNHLGDILLLCAFPALLLISIKLDDLKALFSQHLAKKGAKIAEVLGHRGVQKALFILFLHITIFLAIAVCLVATLSRGAWTGGLVGLLCVYLLYLQDQKSKEKASEEANIGHSHEHIRVKHSHRHHFNSFRHYSKKLKFLGRFIVPLILLMGLFFLLQGKGLELVEGRIEYGLLYSKNDMRWQLYSDTWQMIKENLFLGVGAGNWEKNYLNFMSPLLAGVNPVYLHSDPLQMLAEFGLIASLFFFYIAITLSIGSIKALRSSIPHIDKQIILGLFTGLLAFIVASFVEFPFRIPAVAAYFAIALALLSAALDTAAHQSEK